MAMPIGKPITIESTAQTKIIEIVFIVSSHMPNQPMAKRIPQHSPTMVALRLANQASTPTIRITTGQGVPIKSLSAQMRKLWSGVNSPSIVPP
ncbi:hypothetical protein D3C87_1860700 [compost metagenome]